MRMPLQEYSIYVLYIFLLLVILISQLITINYNYSFLFYFGICLSIYFLYCFVSYHREAKNAWRKTVPKDAGVNLTEFLKLNYWPPMGFIVRILRVPQMRCARLGMGCESATLTVSFVLYFSFVVSNSNSMGVQWGLL